VAKGSYYKIEKTHLTQHKVRGGIMSLVNMSTDKVREGIMSFVQHEAKFQQRAVARAR
jgi:hypothetical protein